MFIQKFFSKIEYPIFQQHDYVAGFSLRPYASGYWSKEGNAFVKINSDGLRDIEHSYSKDKNTLRIVVLGDSFAEGSCVLSENDIAGNLTKEGFSTVNFGVSGSSPLVSLGIVREFSEIIKPKNFEKIKKYFSKNYQPYVIGKVIEDSSKVKFNGKIDWS